MVFLMNIIIPMCILYTDISLIVGKKILFILNYFIDLQIGLFKFYFQVQDSTT